MKLTADIKELKQYENTYPYREKQRENCEGCFDDKRSSIKIEWKIGNKIINTSWYCNLSCFYIKIWDNLRQERGGR